MDEGGCRYGMGLYLSPARVESPSQSRQDRMAAASQLLSQRCASCQGLRTARARASRSIHDKNRRLQKTWQPGKARDWVGREMGKARQGPNPQAAASGQRAMDPCDVV